MFVIVEYCSEFHRQRQLRVDYHFSFEAGDRSVNQEHFAYSAFFGVFFDDMGFVEVAASSTMRK